MSSTIFQRAVKIAKRKKYLDDRAHRLKAANRKHNKIAKASRKKNR
jgi:hypothetical protein